LPDFPEKRSLHEISGLTLWIPFLGEQYAS